MDKMNDLRYPIGTFDFNREIPTEELPGLITEIETMPAALRKAVAGLSEEQLNATYRPGGWTVRQVVHHIADSHINSYIRFRLALTEERPTIKPYDEGKWAELVDARILPIEVSLNILEGIHTRWVTLLRDLKDQTLERELVHPESGILTLATMIGLYAWHGKHHIAHITGLRTRNCW